MTIKCKTIRYEAVAKMKEFNKVKEFLSHISELFSHVDDYIVAYVLLRNWDYDAVKITNVKTDTEKKYVFIEFFVEFESKIEHD